ncbi:MAG: hypothetical protein RR543_03440 [Erysipelotrichales bacterium]
MKLYIVDKVRVNNMDSDVNEKIGNLWRNATTILKDYEKELYGVYYEYEGNYLDDYTLAIATTDHICDEYLEFDNLDYQVFLADTSSEYPVVDVWKKIWDLEDDDKLDRAYDYDFEKYDADGNIEVHISRK